MSSKKCKNINICQLCGAAGLTCEDHVPSRHNYFAKGQLDNVNVISVCACAKCNQGMSEIEKESGFITAFLVKDNPTKAQQEIFDKNIKEIRTEYGKKRRDRLVNSVSETYLYYPDNSGPYYKYKRKQKINWDAPILAIAYDKIVKAAHYETFEEILVLKYNIVTHVNFYFKGYYSNNLIKALDMIEADDDIKPFGGRKMGLSDDFEYIIYEISIFPDKDSYVYALYFYGVLSSVSLVVEK